MPKKYEIKSGRYKGMWHVRIYHGRGKYFHVGRYLTEKEADKAIEEIA